MEQAVDDDHISPPTPSPPPTANIFLLISSILGSKTAGPHTQFVQSFMEECVECLEQGSRGSILQFMPFTMVSAESSAVSREGSAVRPGVMGKALEISPAAGSRKPRVRCSRK